MHLITMHACSLLPEKFFLLFTSIGGLLGFSDVLFTNNMLYVTKFNCWCVRQQRVKCIKHYIYLLKAFYQDLEVFEVTSELK